MTNDKSIVIVTREEDSECGPLGAALRENGFVPLHVPLLETVPLALGESDEDILKSWRDADAIFFSSRRTVQFWFQALASHSLPAERKPGQLVGAVGPATKKELERFGWSVDIVPDDSRGSALVEAALAGGLGAGVRAIVPGAAKLAGDWPEMLAEAGVKVERIALYETRQRTPGAWTNTDSDTDKQNEKTTNNFDKIVQLLKENKIAAITFASPSAVKAFDQFKDKMNWKDREHGLLFAAIGPTTAAALERLGLGPVWQSPETNFPDFAAALGEHISKSNP